MIHWLYNIGVVTFTFAGMEGVAWFSHKYIMHGILWTLHKDHHIRDHDVFLERNDLFFLIFAIPGMACLAIGIWGGIRVFDLIGTGITLYGACYFVIHDIFIHQRLNILHNSENWYLRSIRRAHKIHHKHLGKEDGECFGMLWVPFKYFLETRNRKK